MVVVYFHLDGLSRRQGASLYLVSMLTFTLACAITEDIRTLLCHILLHGLIMCMCLPS